MPDRIEGKDQTEMGAAMSEDYCPACGTRRLEQCPDHYEIETVRVLDPDSGRVLIVTRNVRKREILRVEYAE